MTDTVYTYIVLIVLCVQGLQGVFDNAVVGRLDRNSQNLISALNDAYNVSAPYSVQYVCTECTCVHVLQMNSCLHLMHVGLWY